MVLTISIAFVLAGGLAVSWNCFAVPKVSAEICDGSAFTCDVRGEFEKGPFRARLSICSDRQRGEWMLSGMHFDLASGLVFVGRCVRSRQADIHQSVCPRSDPGRRVFRFASE